MGGGRRHCALLVSEAEDGFCKDENSERELDNVEEEEEKVAEDDDERGREAENVEEEERNVEEDDERGREVDDDRFWSRDWV